ncbi:hypothetical protein C8J57DRAFT_1232266 [Mycena rebaudengoi]|nr:hypothetical protein C8J57DRAFT_1232266 [Mycena rebaudengoi]
MVTFDDLCSILTDPNISGIGVRAAIYIQNLLSFFPAIGFLWDREVSPFELEAAESQYTTILITAFAIFISAMVDARTIGLSTCFLYTRYTFASLRQMILHP